jgi:hypothetical protein
MPHTSCSLRRAVKTFLTAGCFSVKAKDLTSLLLTALSTALVPDSPLPNFYLSYIIFLYVFFLYLFGF